MSREVGKVKGDRKGRRRRREGVERGEIVGKWERTRLGYLSRGPRVPSYATGRPSLFFLAVHEEDRI